MQEADDEDDCDGQEAEPHSFERGELLHLHHVSRYVALPMREVLHGEVLLEDLVDYGFQDCRVVRLGEGLQIGELH